MLPIRLNKRQDKQRAYHEKLSASTVPNLAGHPDALRIKYCGFCYPWLTMATEGHCRSFHRAGKKYTGCDRSPGLRSRESQPADSAK
jgi:hypothetical protein